MQNYLLRFNNSGLRYTKREKVHIFSICDSFSNTLKGEPSGFYYALRKMKHFIQLWILWRLSSSWYVSTTVKAQPPLETLRGCPSADVERPPRKWRGTYRGVVAGNVHQHVGVVPAVDVSVAVPDAADQVTLKAGEMVTFPVQTPSIARDKAALQNFYLHEL